MIKKKIATVAEEAARLFKDNLNWKYYECINKAKEMILDEGQRSN